MENDPIVAAPLPQPTPRGWAQILASYREPSHARSIVEIAITFAPLAALWTLAFFSTITVIHRIRYTYLETERRKLQPTR